MSAVFSEGEGGWYYFFHFYKILISAKITTTLFVIKNFLPTLINKFYIKKVILPDYGFRAGNK